MLSFKVADLFDSIECLNNLAALDYHMSRGSAGAPNLHGAMVLSMRPVRNGIHELKKYYSGESKAGPLIFMT